jgi:serine/threonine/tyrosine-interacting protein
MDSYEMRRQAQLIIPGLYLGPVQSALNSQKMLEMGITHVYVNLSDRSR